MNIQDIKLGDKYWIKINSEPDSDIVRGEVVKMVIEKGYNEIYVYTGIDTYKSYSGGLHVAPEVLFKEYESAVIDTYDYMMGLLSTMKKNYKKYQNNVLNAEDQPIDK